MKSIKILLGGSPCTHWSIAQASKNREVLPSGQGWELFENYVIAKEKFKPDFFIYENNKSMSKEIKAAISKELNCLPTMINSSLVSAQNRQREYWTEQTILLPIDRGIKLKDILISGETWLERSYCLDANYHKTGGIYNPNYQKGRRLMVAEPLIQTKEGKAHCFTATYNKGNRIDRAIEKKQRTLIAEPALLNIPHGFNKSGIKYGKSTTMTANGSWQTNNFVIDPNLTFESKLEKIYEVKDGHIIYKDKIYPIKLQDGFYHIRKLTVTEACRLQTLPDDYCREVSATQAYKGLGNGWTAEVIIHILEQLLNGVSKDTHLDVLSLYDGIGTGRYCLDKMGFKNISYKAYEIDKYAAKVAMSNFPDIIQCGDAFQVRDN